MYLYIGIQGKHLLKDKVKKSITNSTTSYNKIYPEDIYGLEPKDSYLLKNIWDSVLKENAIGIQYSRWHFRLFQGSDYSTRSFFTIVEFSLLKRSK